MNGIADLLQIHWLIATKNRGGSQLQSTIPSLQQTDCPLFHCSTLRRQPLIAVLQQLFQASHHRTRQGDVLDIRHERFAQTVGFSLGHEPIQDLDGRNRLLTTHYRGSEQNLLVELEDVQKRFAWWARRRRRRLYREDESFGTAGPGICGHKHGGHAMCQIWLWLNVDFGDRA